MSEFTIQRIASRDLQRFRELLVLFGHAFADTHSYCDRQPSDRYLQRLLESDTFIAIAAVEGSIIVGGLTAYELHKFEQERSEIYIYDLAVSESHRRRGIATALISELKLLGAERRAYVIFVQAETPDLPAIELYTKLGAKESVLHFDIDVPTRSSNDA